MSRHRAERPRRSPAGPVAVVVGLAMLAGLGGRVTYAYWSDTSTAQASTITSGSLDVTVNGAQGNPSAYAWTALGMSDMAPGESRAAVLTVANAGSIPFGLTATASATGSLVAGQTLVVRVGGTASSDSTYPRTEACSGGTQTFSAALPSSSTTVIATGDAVSVAAGASVAMCVQITLSASASTSLQGTTSTPTFVLTATQS